MTKLNYFTEILNSLILSPIIENLRMVDHCAMYFVYSLLVVS